MANGFESGGVGPIRPEEVAEKKREIIPKEVFETVNRLILENLSPRGKYATVLQDDIVEGLEAAGLDRDDIFDKGWLDIELAYEAVGWKVTYDKPGYNETGRAFFRFETKIPSE